MYERLFRPDRPARIMDFALAVGGIAFAAGFIGPVLLSDSNLGPLLGIFVTGPIGFLVGALIGIAYSARRGPEGISRQELRWLATVWLLSLLYALFFSSIFARGWIALGLLAAVIATAAYLFYGGTLPKDGPIRHYRLPLLLAGLLTLLSLVFPPVVPGAGKPGFAFFLDPRFDASRNVPEFSVDGTILALGWLILTALALTVGYTASSWAEDRRQS